MKDRDHPSLQWWPEIDQHVATADQIELGERRIGHEVVSNEDAAFANVLVDAVAALLAVKEPLEPRRANLLRDRGGVATGTRGLDRFLAQIAAEQLKRAIAETLE